jgi:hypothetical protein
VSSPRYAVGALVQTATTTNEMRPVALRRRGDGQPVDVHGRRTSTGVVLDPLPIAERPLRARTWDSRSSRMRDIVLTGFVYRVRVWDIDERMFAVLEYPEAGLSNPGDTKMRTSTLTVNADRLDEELAALASAARSEAR